jgi:hypothetical protein
LPAAGVGVLLAGAGLGATVAVGAAALLVVAWLAVAWLALVD